MELVVPLSQLKCEDEEGEGKRSHVTGKRSHVTGGERECYERLF